MLLKIELEELCRKPVLWTGFLISILAGLYLIGTMMPVLDIGEEVLRGMDAVRYNRSITAEYEGFLTDRKAEEIIARYGFSRYNDEGGCIYGNYLNRFITENMTDYRYGGNRKSENRNSENTNNENTNSENTNSENRSSTVIYSLRDENSSFGRASYADRLYFSYAEGWENLMEVLMGTAILWGITMAVVLSPMYSCDRSLKTEPVIRSSAEGRRKMPFMRLLAGWIIALGGFLLLGGLLFLLNGFIYGFEGLRANLLCAGAAPYLCPDSLTTGQFWASVYLPRAVLGVTVLVCMTAGISAVCSWPLTSLCVSALLFVYPVISRMLVFKLGIISFSHLFARILMLPNGGMPLYLMIPSFDAGVGASRIFPEITGAVLCLAGLCMLGAAGAGMERRDENAAVSF